MVSVGAQFSTGDQSGNAREIFWISGFRNCQNSACPSLMMIANEQKKDPDHRPSWSKRKKSSTIIEVDHVAGCRMNGDGYGTTVFTCSACGWSTSFQYDEAAEPYYYETRSWDRTPKPKLPRHPWATVRVEEWMRSMNMDPIMIQKCKPFGLLHGPTLCDMTKKQLCALSFTKAEASVLVQAIAMKNESMAQEIVPN